MQKDRKQLEEAKQQQICNNQQPSDIEQQAIKLKNEHQASRKKVESFHISQSIKQLSKEESSFFGQEVQSQQQKNDQEQEFQNSQQDQQFDQPRQSENSSLADNSQLNAKMEQQSASINKNKQIQRIKEIQRIRDIQNQILKQVYCPNQHQGVFFCANPACQNNAVICLQQCECAINHIGCEIRRVQQIFQTFVLQNLLRKDQVSQQILSKLKRYTFEVRNFVTINTEICQNVIKQVTQLKNDILESASKLIQDFTEKTWYPVQFLNIFEKGKFQNLSGKLVNSLIEYQAYAESGEKPQQMNPNIRNFKLQQARQTRIKYQKIFTASVQSLHKKFEIRWRDVRDQIQESVGQIQERFFQANEAYYEDRVKGIFPYQDLKLEQQGEQRIKIQGLQKIEQRYKLSTDSNFLDLKSSSYRVL